MNSYLEITFGAISDALYGFDFPEIDLVVGISESGKAPASMIAHQLGVSLKIVNFSENNEVSSFSETDVESEENLNMEFFGHHRILIVDDIATSGNDLSLVKKRIKADDVYSFVLFGEADYVLFPKVKSRVKLPWNIG